MAKLDLTGLMTGLPTDQDLRTQGQARAAQIQGSGLGSNLARGIASRAPQREETMRQGLGGMFGVDTRTTVERVKEELGKIDTTTPEGQRAAVSLVSQIDGAKALALQTEFNNKNKEEKRVADNYALEQEKVAVARERLQTDNRTLGAGDRKAIREATAMAQEAGARVSVLTGLADQYEKTKPRGGFMGNAYEGWKSLIGGQDEISAMKTRFANVTNSNIINSLPPGVASDKDIEMAKSGFMNASWNAEQIAQFLRGQAKLSAFLAERENMKAQWIDDNSGSTAGFNEAWDVKRKEEGYKEQVQGKYGFKAYDLPPPPVAFDGDTVEESPVAVASRGRN